MFINEMMHNEAKFVEHFNIPKIQNPLFQEKDFSEEDFTLVTDAASKDIVATMFDGVRNDVTDLVVSLKDGYTAALRDQGHSEEADKMSNIQLSQDQISSFLFALIEPDEED